MRDEKKMEHKLEMDTYGKWVTKKQNWYVWWKWEHDGIKKCNKKTSQKIAPWIIIRNEISTPKIYIHLKSCKNIQKPNKGGSQSFRKFKSMGVDILNTLEYSVSQKKNEAFIINEICSIFHLTLPDVRGGFMPPSLF